MSRTTHQTIVIVGTGYAGCSAALELRKRAFEGRIVMIGDEPHLPYERPLLSKAAIVGVPPLLHPAAHYAAQRIDILAGTRADQLNLDESSVSLSDGTPVRYDALLLATGGTARRLNVPGAECAMTLRTFDDALRLHERLRQPGHMTIVGGGVIGLEIAALARTMGWSVIVLESDQRLMARAVSTHVSMFVADVHREEGVDIRLNAQLIALRNGMNGRVEVVTESAVFASDLVVAGIGMQPDIALAADAGIETDGAIVVDELGRTSAHGVFATGDVASFWHARYGRRMRLENWRHASAHSTIVAANMVGHHVRYDEVPWSWTDQYGMNMQIVGLPADADQTVLSGDPGERKFVALHLREGRLTGATLVNQGKDMRPCKALIESGVTLDADRWRDTSLDLRRLAADVIVAPNVISLSA
jgi:3-phenylpropionate/trans-cinnamate dioxygenase ferredoxin reductase subunit